MGEKPVALWGLPSLQLTVTRSSQRWSNTTHGGELYCAGHLLQAAVAHHRATGSRALLDVATRCADHICAVFGPSARRGADGHPEVEMALVELARATGNDRYREQGAFFLDQRGQRPPLMEGSEYFLDYAPLREQRAVYGHAVMALYLFAGATDLYAETGERRLWEALEALWRNLQGHKVYITGGAGSRYEGEAFGEDDELPNGRAYAETCAAIANVMWAWRMLLVTGEARFADALATALYNGVLAGISLDGRAYFYQNPLADSGRHRRQPWFDCPCCPPNLARLIASLPGYCYSTSAEGIWVHLYGSSDATASLPGIGAVDVVQRTNYPWDGAVEIEVRPAAPATFGLSLRIPAWARGATIQVNDEPAAPAPAAGAYAEVRRAWVAGDRVRLALPMPMTPWMSRTRVENNAGRVAFMRGPLVYCLEQVDHPGVDLRDLVVPADAQWRCTWQPGLLGGVVVGTAEGLVERATEPSLYRPYEQAAPTLEPVRITAVPYYAWANRAAGAMQVCVRARGDLKAVPGLP